MARRKTTQTTFLPGMSPSEGEFPERISCEDLLKCSGKRVVLDTETTGLRWWEDHIIGLGVWSLDAEIFGYIPAYEQRERQQIFETVSKLSPETIILGHNLKFDLHFLGANAKQQGWQVLDTTVMIHLQDSRNRKSLAEASKQFLGDRTKTAFKNQIPTKSKNKVWEWPIETIAEYCVNDCRLTWMLAEKLIPELRRLGLLGVLRKEMEYLKLVWAVERHGLKIDVDFCNRALERFLEDRRQAEQELWNAVGYEFNWRSPQQLSKALYEDMGIEKPDNPFADADGVDRTRFAHKGKYNKTMTDSFILMEKTKHPLGELVLHLRETQKLINYIESDRAGSGYLNLMDMNQIIHTNFNLTGTRTARLSSSKPNLQNIPSQIRSRETQSVYSGDTTHRIEEYNLRKALIPTTEGDCYLSIDWRQMEMRMFGILAQEPKMLEKLADGEDIHAGVAEMVWGSRDHVHREWAKTIGFGLIYGMTTGSLEFRLDVEKETANKLARDYWTTFPRIQPWLHEIIQEVKINGFVRYWSGRIWKEENPMDMFKGANAAIQGGCADVLSIAALRCQEWIDDSDYPIHIVSFVHDELVFQLPKNILHDVVKPLSEIMEVRDLFDLPFFTDAKWGWNYGELEKLGGK